MSPWLALLALDGNDLIEVRLVAGGEVQGRLVSADEGTLVLAEGDRRHVVSWALVDEVRVDGALVPVDTVRQQALELQVDDTPEPVHRWTPRPAVAVGASLLWPGGGQLLLGEYGSFAAYSSVELFLVAVAAYNVFVLERTGPLLPLAGVDALFRVYSAYEAHQSATKRRTPLSVGVGPMPSGGLHVRLSCGPANTLPGPLD